MAQAVDQRNAGRARRHALLAVRLELQEVEVVAAIIYSGSACHRRLRGGEKRQAWRQREGLLAAGEQHVETEFVEIHRHGGEAGDGVRDEHHIRVLLLQRRDFRDGAEHASGGLIVDEGHGVELTGGQALVDLVGTHGLAPLHGVGFGFLAAALGHVQPLVGESAVAAVEDLFLHQIADGTLHHAPGGGSAQKHLLFRAKERLQHRLDLGVKVLEPLAAMPDHWLRHRSVGVRADFNGSRDVKFDVGAHAWWKGSVESRALGRARNYGFTRSPAHRPHSVLQSPALAFPPRL